MDDYDIPGMGTWAAPGWGGSSTTEPTYTPSREAVAPPTSQLQVSGTSGSPNYTPSGTHGGSSVATGNPGGAPDMPGSIVPIPRQNTGYDNILRAMEMGARIQRRRFGMPEELY
jgi:hypothetical protein